MPTTDPALFPLPNKQFNDALNGGFRKGGLYLITGNKSVGKSTLLRSFANHLAADHAVAFISTISLPEIEKWFIENTAEIVFIDAPQTELYISKILKQLAEKFSIPIVATIAEDIRDNGGMEEYCDVMIEMHRPEFYKVIFGETEFKITKNNYGALCSFHQRAVFNEIKFVEIER